MRKSIVLVMLIVMLFCLMAEVAQAYSKGNMVTGTITILEFVKKESGYNIYVASGDGSWSQSQLMLVASIKALVGKITVRGTVVDYVWITDTLKLPLVILY